MFHPPCDRGFTGGTDDGIRIVDVIGELRRELGALLGQFAELAEIGAGKRSRAGGAEASAAAASTAIYPPML